MTTIYVDMREPLPPGYEPELLVSESTGLAYEIYEYHPSRRTPGRLIFNVSRVGVIPVGETPHVRFRRYRKGEKRLTPNG